MADVTIIGAGVAGLWAAWMLSKAGLTPRLIDRNGAPGAHGCSWWAGGMLAPYCEGAVAEPVIVGHGQNAARAWAEVTQVSRRGSLVVALDRDTKELARFGRRTTGHAMITDGLRQLEPDLHGPGQALFFADEAHLDPRAALSDLVAALAARGIDVETGEATPEEIDGPVIDARGMAADLPGLRAVRGEMVVLKAGDISLTRPVRLLHPRHPLYIVPRGDGVYMLGATQIESADRRGISARSLLELLSAAYALDARFAEAEVLETGADLRPAFADNVPRVVRRGRVLHLNGLFRHGYLMAPALAKQAADFLTMGIKGDLFHED
ncbi:FAD-dependent oxidoreductase [Roseinatronobacter alkalisoli]|uniref:FAD-dependent oxidoreductase n=1 Tax=Roseinatronobacter alkalisoli TaxID=3028235 RepID=A0ABT5T8W2_9RHOB|nr:FAD-dependent oxidoreductase [Roseinatronobacter sp. HJB301]MDD7971564.1 FAD-dependent oxidoreductase [Roseinatronobacter sp. HJB301]